MMHVESRAGPRGRIWAWAYGRLEKLWGEEEEKPGLGGSCLTTEGFTEEGIFELFQWLMKK